MVSKKSIEKQLKKIDFDMRGWGRGEAKELHNIILPDEEIYECVNGLYDGGFALLIATDVRVLLVDKKPMSFLTVEDLRFDMINEIDYNHRLFGAYITITTGNKTLIFRSYNKARLRKLISHVQHCMAEVKKKQTFHVEGQSQHLEKINQQLQAYLVAQYKQQQKFQEQMNQSTQSGLPAPAPEPVRPPNELSDFLYAHGLLDKYREETGKDPTRAVENKPVSQPTEQVEADKVFPWTEPQKVERLGGSQLEEIYSEGLQEVFGKQRAATSGNQASTGAADGQVDQSGGLVVNPIKVAYSKLPQALGSRKFGLPHPSLPVYRPVSQKTKPEP
ncbi:MAG TPA: PH domain-containing protein, partial [Candidatus Saccharimonadales bacterium]|nr:PH domain-containing protein [Candidatus Saccharimonadales bacterium]